jgi:hypothetical protein
MKARLRTTFTTKPKRTILVSVLVLLCAALAVTAAGIGPGLVAAAQSAGSKGKPVYPTNANGETYGIAPTFLPEDYPDGQLPPLSLGDYPDLIAATGEGGIEGYIRQSEADPFELKSPKEALAWQEEYQAQGGFHYCNLYDKGGNVIGRFRVGN